MLQLIALTRGTVKSATDADTYMGMALKDENDARFERMQKLINRHIPYASIDHAVAGTSVASIHTAARICGMDELAVSHIPEFCHDGEDTELYELVRRLKFTSARAYLDAKPDLVETFGKRAAEAVKQEAELYGAHIMLAVSEPGLMQAMLLALPGAEEHRESILEVEVGPCEWFVAVFNRFGSVVSFSALLLA